MRLCVVGHPCVFVRAAALVNMLCPLCTCECACSSGMCGVWREEMWFFMSFSFTFLSCCYSFIQSLSSSPSYSSCSCCLNNSSYSLLIPHVVFFFSFLPHLLFVQLNLCIHFSLIVLPFRFLLLLLRSGIYFPLKSVTATLENNVDSIFPHNRSFGCSRGGCKVRAWGPSSADAWPNLYNGLHR